MAGLVTQHFTAEQFFTWANQPANRETRYELVAGEVTELPSPGELHGYLCWLAIRILTEYLTRRGSGYLLTNDAGLVVRRSPDTVRGPDVMLFLENRALADLKLGFCERVPTLIVEVRSPTDRESRLLRRIEQYHQLGVAVVWVIDGEEHCVTVYRPNEFPKVLDETETLVGNGALIDFSCPVVAFFNSSSTNGVS
jgi:Uma2 family endonuclease